MYEDLIKALRRNMVETGSLICLGCGHEHNCGTQGCAIMRDAADALEAMRRAEPGNEPLTLDELREMDGQPVWCDGMQEWRIVWVCREGDCVRLYSIRNTISAEHVLRNDGRIYRRKPEPEGGAR